MKNPALLISAFFLLFFVACNKVDHSCYDDNNGYSATLVRDCTGTYLRVDGKDYHVCNTELTDGIANGSLVKTVFYTTPECNGTAKDQVVCLMYHENEGWIDVKYIKAQ